MREQNQIKASLPLLSGICLKAASEALPAKKISCGFSELDTFLEGGLPRGSVCEWGMPLGRGGRSLLVSWLAHLTKHHTDERPMVLWCSGHRKLQVYPPAWLSRGVDLERIRFAYSSQPLTELRPVFMEPLFNIIILDVPKGLGQDDCAWLARRARANGQTIILLRDFFLSEKRGNIWAPLRLNCWTDPTSHQWRLRVVRGLSPRQISLDIARAEQSA